ncbi:hypothetical protein HDU86_006982 [Geranomyces michiganensis]|nr:hypothetical protein HDU86_006982 [Geranomyces michiganensis]
MSSQVPVADYTPVTSSVSGRIQPESQIALPPPAHLADGAVLSHAIPAAPPAAAAAAHAATGAAEVAARADDSSLLEDEDWRRKDSGVDVEECTKVFATPSGKMVRIIHEARPPPCHEGLTYHASLKRARTLDLLHPHLNHSHIIDVHDHHHHLHNKNVPFMRRRSVKWTLTIIMFLLLVAVAAFVGIVLKSRSG